jgi:hypothetical protein
MGASEKSEEMDASDFLICSFKLNFSSYNNL